MNDSEYDIYGHRVGPPRAPDGAGIVTPRPAAQPAPTAEEQVGARYASRTAVDLADFVSGPLAQPRWAVEGIWPDGAAGVIAGKPKDGKSTLAVELAVSLWSGTPMFGLADFPTLTRPAPVIYLQQENGTPRVKRDFEQILAARRLGRIDAYWNGTDPEDATVGEWHEEFEWMVDSEWDAPPLTVLSQQGYDLSDRIDQLEIERRIVETAARYLFLDPLYMLVGNRKISDGGDELRPVLMWLTQLKDRTGCAPIVTHHMTSKDDSAFGPEGLIGTTFLYGWYEAALFVRQGALSIASGSLGQTSFRVKVDARRDMAVGISERTLLGLGVGRWAFEASAQNQVDAEGRNAPRVAAAKTRAAQARALAEANPDWSPKRIAEEIGVSRSTAQRYLAGDDADGAGAEPIDEEAAATGAQEVPVA